MFETEYGHFINGEWVGGLGGKTIAQFNPATGEQLACIQAGAPADIERAVDAAAAAFNTWSASPFDQRQELLTEIARRIRARGAEYGRMESLNNGKTITEASYFDVPNAADTFSFFASAAHSLSGGLQDYPDAIALRHLEPIGVCAQIIPWNAPLLMAAAKIAPAIVCGNTVVLKPAETTCLTILEFLKDISDLLPPGLINVVTGHGAEIGKSLVSHPDVRKVAFTGSTLTGRKIIEYAAHNLIPQTLELGGKSAQIVCASADIDSAVEGAALSTVFNKGEVCLAGSRVFVHDSIKADFLDRLITVMRGIRIGNPLDPSTQLGAQASQAQFDKIRGYLKLAVEEGAVPVAGGDIAHVEGNAGYFIQPTILDAVRSDMRIAQEEIFGPVTAVIGWTDEREMLAEANGTQYGLAGGVWSRDLTQAHRIARGLQTGTVWLNRYFNFRVGMSIGGYKQSGFGREFSTEALHSYTQTKTVVVNMDDGPIGIFN